MRILFAGGGTLGSVMPLLAIAEKVRKKTPHIECLFVGTKQGPEKSLIKEAGFAFMSIPAGKLRRYFSFKNITDLFKLAAGFLKSIYILYNFRPSLIVGAGSYVQVPLIVASATCYRKARIMIHQQDITPGLANILVASFANRITSATQGSTSPFSKGKTVVIGNPVREHIYKGTALEAIARFNLEENTPVVLILGGGTGAARLNALLAGALPELTKTAQIIHITGKGKQTHKPSFRYHPFEIMKNELAHAYAVADVVVTRAGFSTLCELSHLAKPTIIIPMHETHQEENARYFGSRKAALVVSEEGITAASFADIILNLLQNEKKRFELSTQISCLMPHDAGDRFIAEIESLLAPSPLKRKRW